MPGGMRQVGAAMAGEVEPAPARQPRQGIPRTASHNAVAHFELSALSSCCDQRRYCAGPLRTAPVAAVEARAVAGAIPGSSPAGSSAPRNPGADSVPRCACTAPSPVRYTATPMDAVPDHRALARSERVDVRSRRRRRASRVYCKATLAFSAQPGRAGRTKLLALRVVERGPAVACRPTARARRMIRPASVAVRHAIAGIARRHVDVSPRPPGSAPMNARPSAGSSTWPDHACVNSLHRPADGDASTPAGVRRPSDRASCPVL